MLSYVKADIYDLVRAPYLKMSSRRYYTIVLLVYIPNMLISYSTFIASSEDETARLKLIVQTFKSLKTPVIPFLVFVISGTFYYRSCNYYGIE